MDRVKSHDTCLNGLLFGMQVGPVWVADFRMAAEICLPPLLQHPLPFQPGIINYLYQHVYHHVSIPSTVVFEPNSISSDFLLEG